MLSEDGASSVPSESKRARGRPRKQTATLDHWLNNTTTTATTNTGTKKSKATTEVVSPIPVATGRKAKQQPLPAASVEQEAVSDLEETATPAKKKTKKQLQEEQEEEYLAAMRNRKSSKDTKKLTKKEQQALDDAATAAAAQEQLKGKKSSKRNSTELLSSPTVDNDKHTNKRQRQQENTSIDVSEELTLKLVPVRSKDDNKKYTAANLYILERRLKDILNDIEAYEVPDFTESDRSETKKKVVTSKRKNKKEENVGTRRLAEDFESVPYDVIPEYDSLVERVVTLDSMQESLSVHKYKTMAEFSEDFYVLLNNARTITPPGSAVSGCVWLSYCVHVCIVIVW